jgi:hypothetical protein
MILFKAIHLSSSIHVSYHAYLSLSLCVVPLVLDL